MYSVDLVLMDWFMLTLIWAEIPQGLSVRCSILIPILTTQVLTLASLSNLAKRSLRMRTSSSGSHVAESAEKKKE